MSEKLSFQESAKSANAISMYRKDNSENTNKRVIVKKNGQDIFNDEITVIAGDYNSDLKVNIMWEDANFDYKEKGLFGYYSSAYYKVSHANGVLSIYSDDITITIV